MAEGRELIRRTIARTLEVTRDDSDNEFGNILTSTRQCFRRRSSRGRKSSITFPKKTFLLRRANTEFFPIKQEVEELQRMGLGSKETRFNIEWNAEAIELHICSLYPQAPLSLVGFRLGKVNRQRKIIIISDIENGQDLKSEVSSNYLIIIPNRDLPRNEPPNLQANIISPSTSSTVGTRSRQMNTGQRQNNRRNLSLRRISVENRQGSDEEQRNEVDTINEVVNSTRSLAEMILLPENTYSRGQAMFPTLLRELAPVTINLDVDRSNIIETLFELYEDPEITKKNLSVKFVGEQGIDGGGLLSEMFTIFWQKNFDSLQYFKGHDIVVPYLPLHRLRKSKPDFVILGRILSHMMLLTKTIPNKLAIYTLTALSTKEEDYTTNREILLKDFYLYLTTAERKLVVKAYDNFGNLTELEKGRLTSLYTSNNLHVLPNKSEVQDQILTIAEKIIISDPKELYAEMRKGVPEEIVQFLSNITLDNIYEIWNNMQPTAEKVMERLKCDLEVLSNDQENTFYYLQNFVGSLSKTELEKFLLFVTGSVHLPEEITVTFHDEVGLARRPKVHTCSNTLELGGNFITQNEFDAEFLACLYDENCYFYDMC